MSVERLDNMRLLRAYERIIEEDARCNADTDGQDTKWKVSRQRRRTEAEVYKRLQLWLKSPDTL